LGVIPNRELFLEFKLGAIPQAFFESENANLQEATQTIQANFAYTESNNNIVYFRLKPYYTIYYKHRYYSFEVAPPSINNTLIASDPQGLNPNQFSYYNTDTEIFWFIHDFFNCFQRSS